MSATTEAREVAEILLQRARRSTPKHLPRPTHFLVAKDTGASAKYDAGTDVGMLAEADLTAENCSVFDDA